MTSAVSELETLRSQLVQQYRKLPPLDQQVLWLFSVIYEPISKTMFTECFLRANIRNDAGNVPAASAIKYRVDKLLQAGLLVQGKGQGPACNPLLVEIATRDAIEVGQFETLVKAVHQTLPVRSSWKNGPRYFNSRNQFIREVRIGLYRKDLPFVYQQFEDFQRYSYLKEAISVDEILWQICNNPFDRAWFLTLPHDLYERGLSSILSKAALTCTPADEAIALLQEECAKPDGRCSDPLRLTLAEQLLLRGQFQEAQTILESMFANYDDTAAVLWGWLTFLRGQREEAIAHYTTALKTYRKATGKRQFFPTIGGLFFVLALLQEGSAQSLQDATEYADVIARQAQHGLKTTYERLWSVLRLQQGDLTQRDYLLSLPIPPYTLHHSIETLFCALCLHWVDAEQAGKQVPKVLEPLYNQAKASGYDWIAMEAAQLFAPSKPRSKAGKEAKAWYEAKEIVPLTNLIQPQEPWEICLKALSHLHRNEASPSAASAENSLRLAWFISYYSPTSYAIQPREQKINAQGGWSKGRPVALKRLKQTGELPYLTSQDIQVCSYIEVDSGYYGKTDYWLNEGAIAALVGHPLVFWEDSPTVRVEVVKGEPELLVTKGKRDWLILSFSPQLPDKGERMVVKETPTRLKVITITSEHRRIAEIIGSKNHLEVPAIAKERVLAAINAVSSIVTVHSDIGGGVDNAEEVAADSTPHVHLLPAGDGLKVAVLSRPFANGGPYYRPGTGGETVIAEIDGKRWQTTRNLKEEKKLANGAIAACPTLSEYDEEAGEWLISEPEDCLELLMELQPLGDSIQLEWPEGEKLRVSHQADLKGFSMRIQRQKDWFEASGELQLEDNLVLDMQRLMELLKQTPSRFIPLGNGEFLALTHAFRKRLDELRAFSEGSGKGVKFHPLASMALEEFVDEVGDLKTDQHWKSHIKRLKEMETLQPEVPSTLQAELRDYQIDGFEWLARLAHWGVGACLADDMGLGKTLQALALVLTRAAEGPTLILAPTSVCMNWISEAQRFAPTLNVIQLGSGDGTTSRQSQRQAVLDQIRPFDMLVCSYGLLQQEDVAEMLSKVEWQTIVLDEAQAIKNAMTKRSQAAMKLQGRFKLITTGTPIENHLGELWNLFRFINPGLLGSLERFNQNFATPIERYQDKQARQRLKKLIQPFLLRRTKNQVLDELPSRTEITLHVELSQEEMAMYEALRREAIAKLSSSDATAGAKHLQVLAEIMRLRRMCCNPQLVMPETPLTSSKLQVFGEVLEELLENRHKSLVFSQFVDHLKIIRAYLDEHKIHYQYLDGSTPAGERKKRVDAFQAGEGDVFLISLKAGGTGLNLTAADYVIHMDPWWNPAVEDQASDRAHRIGQQRPVTIYRLVAKGTIEEKIVELHQHKRDLADSLLEGADVSGKMSTDELLQLIQFS